MFFMFVQHLGHNHQFWPILVALLVLSDLFCTSLKIGFIEARHGILPIDQLDAKPGTRRSLDTGIVLSCLSLWLLLHTMELPEIPNQQIIHCVAALFVTVIASALSTFIGYIAGAVALVFAEQRY